MWAKASQPGGRQLALLSSLYSSSAMKPAHNRLHIFVRLHSFRPCKRLQLDTAAGTALPRTPHRHVCMNMCKVRGMQHTSKVLDSMRAKASLQRQLAPLSNSYSNSTMNPAEV
jgi:uncharacterized protein involved in copper resistance